MLRELQISQFAIIEKQSIEFGSGLNVISGETGAGKSVILQAFDLILGGRPKPKYIRTGTEGWQVEALFDLSSLPQNLREQLPESIEGDELVVSRSMSSSGRGKVYLNGHLGSVSLLQETCRSLMNICAQGHHVRLLEPTYHLELVDTYADNGQLLQRYKQRFAQWKELSHKLHERKERREQNLLRRAELEFVVEELSSLAIHETLRQELETEISRLTNSEQILEQVGALLEVLQNERSGVSGMLDRVFSELQGLSRLDSSFSGQIERVSRVQQEIEELEIDLQGYAGQVELLPEELESLRERLSSVASLERKYRTDCSGLVSLFKRAEEELSLLDDEYSLGVLEQECESAYADCLELAEKLRATRKIAAGRLVQEVSQELAELNMPDALLSVSVEEGELGVRGADRVELRISTNKGEPLRPLREIASGGELSRIMLVLKKVLRDTSGVDVLVFDEVDTGVSGGVARSVGEKLKQLSEHSQVVCITHLAQVASLADRHFLVEKVVADRTTSVLRALSSEERVEEIARMLAGYEITAATRESARELLSSNL